MWCTSLLRKKRSGEIPVYLNVYDLTTANVYAYWFGFGIYHSGVEVHGVEYAFGAHDHPTSGIFEVQPTQCPGFTFRKRIRIGYINLNPREVRSFIRKLSEEYVGCSYNLFTRNCNHFSKEACLRLTGKRIPLWVNRMARLGLLCNCVLPAALNEKKVGRVRSESSRPDECEKNSKAGDSSRFSRSTTTANPPTSSSVSSTSSSTSPSFSLSADRQRRCFPLALSVTSRPSLL